MTHLRSFAGGFAALAILLLCPLGTAQDENLQQFDPSDVYFQAWLVIRDAEKLEKDGKFLDAFNNYEKARKLFDTVALYHPEWKPHLVKDRQQTTAKSIEDIRQRALAEQRAAQQRVEDLVEGPTVPGPAGPPAIGDLTPEERQKIAGIQKQINSLRSQLGSGGDARDANAARMRRQLAELEDRRKTMARAPIDGQMTELNNRIAQLQQERDAMALALRDSRNEHQKALAELATLRADSDASRRKAAKLEQSLATERKVSNEVVAGLRNQLAELKEANAQKDKLLHEANARTARLERELEESRAEIADLRDERDQLLKERDQMAALLKLNESERVQLLIEQNMKLGRDLKTAQDRLAAVAADNDSTKDQLLTAKRDLAMAKGRIIELQRDTSKQQERLLQLEARLKQAGEELDDDSALAEIDAKSREEIQMLRDIVQRQLRVQQRRRQAKEILFAEVKRLGVEDKAFMGALSMATGQELKLTAEENQLLEDRKIDDEFVFSDHPSEEERHVAGRELQQRIQVKTGLARRSFSNGRYFVAREFFESIIDEDHPGHVPSMLNLGVVYLRMEEPRKAVEAFENALAIRDDQPLPYAHFMLGVSHYESQQFEDARKELNKALGLDPSNAKAHVFLGSIAGLQPDFDSAERHFQEALRLDPTLTEPFYNLAVIRAEQGRNKEALEFYRRAIENGADPDLDFEDRIGR